MHGGRGDLVPLRPPILEFRLPRLRSRRCLVILTVLSLVPTTFLAVPSPGGPPPPITFAIVVES